MLLTLRGLGTLQVVLQQGSTTLGCDLSHAFSYSRLGGFTWIYEMCCALVVTVLRASNVLPSVLNGVSYG